MALNNGPPNPTSPETGNRGHHDHGLALQAKGHGKKNKSKLKNKLQKCIFFCRLVVVFVVAVFIVVLFVSVVFDNVGIKSLTTYFWNTLYNYKSSIITIYQKFPF